MRKNARLLTAVAVIASLVCASPVAAHAATGSAHPPAAGWRIVATFPTGSVIDDLAVSGPGSAWAVESCSNPCKSADGVILRHWNGKAWSAQPRPALSKHTGNDEPQLTTAPGSKDVWAVYNIYDGKSRASAAEWTGKSWGAATLFPVGVGFTSVVAFGPADVWAFGSSGDWAQYTARFDGKAWSRAPQPGSGVGLWVASSRSADDFWAQSLAAKGISLAVSRWNGKRWVKQAVPAAPNSADGATGVAIARTQATPVTGTSEWLYHVSAAGRWLKLPIPGSTAHDGAIKLA